MRRFMIQFLMVVFSSHLVCAQTPTSLQHSKSSKQQNMEKQLRDTDLEFSKQTGIRRLEAWMEFFAEDAVMVRDGKTITGKQSIRELYAPVFANKDFFLSWTPTRVEVSKDGNLGYTYGDFEARTGQKTSRGMYVTIWRKEAGKWKAVLDTGSSPTQQPKEAQ